MNGKATAISTTHGSDLMAVSVWIQFPMSSSMAALRPSARTRCGAFLPLGKSGGSPISTQTGAKTVASVFVDAVCFSAAAMPSAPTVARAINQDGCGAAPILTRRALGARFCINASSVLRFIESWFTILSGEDFRTGFGFTIETPASARIVRQHTKMQSILRLPLRRGL